MKIIRDILRKFRYELKFFIKKKKSNTVYFNDSSSDKELENLMNRYGSDKGDLTNHHNYTNYYSKIFFNKKEYVKNFLEIGLGTNNINIPSNMGIKGTPLASLRAWRDYFFNANIYGGDIDKDILKDEKRIKTFFVDQTKPDAIKKMFDEIGVKEFDVIFEDGLHEFKANICFFECAINHLSKGGIYIIEDVYIKDQKKFLDYFKKTKYNFSIVDIYHPRNIANNCIMIIKK